MIWWLSYNNMFLGDEHGLPINNKEISKPDADTIRVLQARCLLNDPSSIIGYTNTLEGLEGSTGTILTTGNGSYYYMGEEPKKLELRVSDIELRMESGSIFDVAQKQLKKEIIKLDNDSYIISFTAGGQSTTFAGLTEVSKWLHFRLRQIRDLEGSRVRVKIKKAPVGWSYE